MPAGRRDKRKHNKRPSKSFKALTQHLQRSKRTSEMAVAQGEPGQSKSCQAPKRSLVQHTGQATRKVGRAQTPSRNHSCSCNKLHTYTKCQGQQAFIVLLQMCIPISYLSNTQPHLARQLCGIKQATPATPRRQAPYGQFSKVAWTTRTIRSWTHWTHLATSSFLLLVVMASNLLAMASNLIASSY